MNNRWAETPDNEIDPSSHCDQVIGSGAQNHDGDHHFRRGDSARDGFPYHDNADWNVFHE